MSQEPLCAASEGQQVHVAAVGAGARHETFGAAVVAHEPVAVRARAVRACRRRASSYGTKRRSGFGAPREREPSAT